MADETHPVPARTAPQNSSNGERRSLADWPVLESPYINLAVYDGILKVNNPLVGAWQLQTTLRGPHWTVSNPVAR
ncbi:hypothetical protein [Lyngbya sp. CCY1209]|uniref:hypothetical protein n=1 Tax=Lyngbya sp. CCY1209 TaxID=2886103 RepID=UPI002D1FDC01|nr:hypothetical protein [Lyngbya sp. CCY1209]MEB3885266.1 hypothetical protein [Lyngbya sp. CCY1209]